MQSPSADVRTAVACAFYEHLPTTPVLRQDLPRRFGRAAFAELRDVFRYHLSPDEAAAFEREFFEAEQKFVREEGCSASLQVNCIPGLNEAAVEGSRFKGARDAKFSQQPPAGHLIRS